MNDIDIQDITLRNVFAMFALAGRMANANCDYEPFCDTAKICYEQANAMIEARKEVK